MEKERKITVIPATVNPRVKNGANALPAKRRVAGYARVSTDKDEQFTSYEAQIDYYTKFIQRHSDWEFIKVYTDEGISGLNTKNREGFNQMIADAMAGKLDLIVTKSVSRFARNTVDSLVTIRQLKEKGVEVFFEKENIYTFDGKGELLLTIMSSLAQEESRSISENVTWGQRKRFSDGKFTLPYKRFLGYERGATKDSPPVINQEQAALVRRIYSMFMEGQTPNTIAKILTNENIPSPGGKEVWQSTTVESILTNETYKGCKILQKQFTTDFLTKKRKDNEGELQQYYIENSHEAIIDPAEWDLVQEEVRRRKAIGRNYTGKSVFGSRVICGDCGSQYGRKVWHSNDKYRKYIWRCNCKYEKGRPVCATPVLTETEIKERFLHVYNQMITNKKSYIKACKAMKKSFTDTSAIDTEIKELENEISVIEELMRKSAKEDLSTEAARNRYIEKNNRYIERREKAEERYKTLIMERKEKKKKAEAINGFIKELQNRDELITEFDAKLWMIAIKKVVVMNDGSLHFYFNNGSEITG